MNFTTDIGKHISKFQQNKKHIITENWQVFIVMQAH